MRTFSPNSPDEARQSPSHSITITPMKIVKIIGIASSCLAVVAISTIAIRDYLIGYMALLKSRSTLLTLDVTPLVFKRLALASCVPISSLGVAWIAIQNVLYSP